MAVRLALTGSSIAASFGVANAQTAPPASAANTEPALAEVVVTGSRIAAPNQVSVSPVTFVSAADVQTTGVTRVEDLLNELPQVFASQGSNASNGADGTATVNLRGLGAKRTLVLVDGFRLGPGDPTSGSAADINMIPTALIDSIEILTGGASSTYGADAVGGVVNFKLNDHFEGVKLVADGGIYQNTNTNTQGVQSDLVASGPNYVPAPSSVWAGAQRELTFIAGLNSPDGQGNATFYAGYRNVLSVIQAKYSVSACTFGSGYVAGSSNTGGKFVCSGSGTTSPARFISVPSSTVGLNPHNLQFADDTVTPNGTLTPFTNADRYNYGALNYFQRPDERYTAGSFIHYDFNEHATVYAQTMFMNDDSIAQIASSGAFQAPVNVNCANPFITASELAAWCGGSTTGYASGTIPGNPNSGEFIIGKRNVEGGNRLSDLEHTDFHEVIGIKGKIDDAWDYDASVQYSMVNLYSSAENYFSVAKLNNAFDVVSVGGVPTCQITVSTGAACVPYNIFTPGKVTPAMLNYLYTVGEEPGEVRQKVFDVNFTGDLGKYGVQLPTASSGLKVNVGAEYRDVTDATFPDTETQLGDLSGGSGPVPPVSGGVISKEGFMEAAMPIFDDMPGAKALDLSVGYRYSSYNTGFDTNTYKFAVDYSPISDVRFRGSFQRAVRAPNVVELFSPQSVSLDGTIDPCAGPSSNPGNPTLGTVNGYSFAQCARTGVTAGEFGKITPNSAAQYNGLTGGNPTLKPETALTSSFGVGLTPTFLPNFRAQIDYFDIKIENVIETIGSNLILTDCLTADLFCDDIHRSAIGSLWLGQSGFVTDSLQNVGQLETKGVDVDLEYAFDMGAAGKLHTSLLGTYLSEYEVTPIQALGTSAYNCAGYYGPTCSNFGSGAGTPVFRWRNTLRTTWQAPWQGLDVTLSWRYFSPVKLEALSPNTNLAAAPGQTIASGGISNTDAFISSYSYFDLTAAIKLADKVTLRLGCNNILDKQPPVIGATNLPAPPIGNGNTMPQVYDSLGRYIFGSIIAQF
jgi:outer membrane receptor protein involved in Fe transport